MAAEWAAPSPSKMEAMPSHLSSGSLSRCSRLGFLVGKAIVGRAILEGHGAGDCDAYVLLCIMEYPLRSS